MRSGGRGVRNEGAAPLSALSEVDRAEGLAMDMKDITPDEILDCVGLACPMPIFKTTNRIREMQSGRILEVQSDDDGIVKDMPAWCNKTGHEFLGIVKTGDEYHAYVRKR